MRAHLFCDLATSSDDALVSFRPRFVRLGDSARSQAPWRPAKEQVNGWSLFGLPGPPATPPYASEPHPTSATRTRRTPAGSREKAAPARADARTTFRGRRPARRAAAPPTSSTNYPRSPRTRRPSRRSPAPRARRSAKELRVAATPRGATWHRSRRGRGVEACRGRGVEASRGRGVVPKNRAGRSDVVIELHFELHFEIFVADAKRLGHGAARR